MIKRAAAKAKAEAETAAIIKNSVSKKATPGKPKSATVVKKAPTEKKAPVDKKVEQDRIKSAQAIRKANEMKHGVLAKDGGKKVIMIAPPAPMPVAPGKQELHVVHHHVYNSPLPGHHGPVGPFVGGHRG